MVVSPLGRYAPIIASAVVVAIVAAFLIALLLGPVLGITDSDKQSLRELALIALGALFGSVATVNGVKKTLDAAHRRLDLVEEQTHTNTHPENAAPPGD